MTEQGRAEAGGHVPALDGLRGAAIISVMLFHYAPYMSATSAWARIATNLRMSLWAGVDLFFVLSGFLITGILLRTRSEPHYFRNFIARRTLRIFPLYFGILAVATVCLPARDAATAPVLWTQNPLWAWLYGMNIAVAINESWHFFIHSINVSHFWSLAVEEHFYLLWPAIVWWCSVRRLAYVCGTLVSGALLTRLVLSLWLPPISLYVLTPCRMDSLALGALVAIAAQDADRLARLATPARMALAIAGTTCILLFAAGGGALLGREYPAAGGRSAAVLAYTALATTFASALVLTVGVRGVLRRVFSCRLLGIVGTYSYGLYVYHDALAPWFHVLNESAGYREHIASVTMRTLVDMAVNCAISFAVAVASYHLYEKPFLRLKRFFV